MKRYMLIALAALCGLMLISCGKDSAESSVPAEESIVSESSEESSSEPPEESSVPAEEEGRHDVTLCNGLGQDITALRIRSGDGDYWSFEILAGTLWQDGTAISLTLTEEEWVFTPAWEAEVTLADGTVTVYGELPLSDASIVELTPDGINSEE